MVTTDWKEVAASLSWVLLVAGVDGKLVSLAASGIWDFFSTDSIAAVNIYICQVSFYPCQFSGHSWLHHISDCWCHCYQTGSRKQTGST